MRRKSKIKNKLGSTRALARVYVKDLRTQLRGARVTHNANFLRHLLDQFESLAVITFDLFRETSRRVCFRRRKYTTLKNHGVELIEAYLLTLVGLKEMPNLPIILRFSDRWEECEKGYIEFEEG